MRALFPPLAAVAFFLLAFECAVSPQAAQDVVRGEYGQDRAPFSWYVPEQYLESIKERLPNEVDIRPAPEKGSGAIILWGAMAVGALFSIVADLVCALEPSVVVDLRRGGYALKSDIDLPRGLVIVITDTDHQTLTCADRAMPSTLTNALLGLAKPK